MCAVQKLHVRDKPAASSAAMAHTLKVTNSVQSAVSDLPERSGAHVRSPLRRAYSIPEGVRIPCLFERAHTSPRQAAIELYTQQ